MISHRIAKAVLILVSVSHVGRSECEYLGEKPSCDNRPWSHWSSCDYPCGTSGTQTRTKLNVECYRECNFVQETRQCTGTLPVDCELSSWSEWSTCNFVDELCAFSRTQRATRYKSRREECGGTCLDASYERSRQCACLNGGTPFPNSTCQCKEDFYGACCEHKKESSWNKGWLGFLSLLLFVACCCCVSKDDNRVGPG